MTETTSYTERFVYKGDKSQFSEKLFELKKRLFELVRDKEIERERKAIKRRLNVLSIKRVGCRMVWMKHETKEKDHELIMAFLDGVDRYVAINLFREYGFKLATQTEVKRYFEPIEKKPGFIPAREGVYIRVYDNKRRGFIPEYQLIENLSKFLVDDEGFYLINPEGKEDYEVLSELIDYAEEV